MYEEQPTRNVVIGVVGLTGLLLVGFYFLIWHLGRDARFWLQTRDGLEVPVREVRELFQEQNPEGYGAIHVRYLYEVDGKQFIGTQASIHRDGDNFGPFLNDLYRRISATKEGRDHLTCFVNSGDPTISVIDNTLRPSRVAVESLFSIGWIAFMGYPWVICLGILRKRWSARRKTIMFSSQQGGGALRR